MWSSNGEEGLGWMSQRQRRLILGEPELLPARLAILFVANATRAVSLEVEILAVSVSLAPPAVHGAHTRSKLGCALGIDSFYRSAWPPSSSSLYSLLRLRPSLQVLHPITRIYINIYIIKK
ncbi:hypothetical protein FF1_035618 [Malus domestica]